jgi:hypothetical protein
MAVPGLYSRFVNQVFVRLSLFRNTTKVIHEHDQYNLYMVGMRNKINKAIPEYDVEDSSETESGTADESSINDEIKNDT